MVWLKCSQLPSSSSGENRLWEGMGNGSQKPGRRGLQARDEGDWMGGDSEGSEAGWNCGYIWKVEPPGGADRLGVR